MFADQNIIIVLTICIALGLILYFFQKNKKVETDHFELVLKLEKSFILNASQIQKRQNGLDTYHFLKYNLSEALRIQSEIIS